MSLFLLRGSFGLDLGTTAIRAACVEQTASGYRLTAFTEIPQTKAQSLETILKTPPFHHLHGVVLNPTAPAEVLDVLSGRRLQTEDPFTASMRCFVSPKDEKPRLFLEIGADKSTVGFWADGLHACETLSDGSAAWMDALATALHTTPADAEHLKRTYGLTPGAAGGLVFAVLDDLLTDYATELTAALDHFTYRYRAPREIPVEIFGGGANLIGITSALSKKIGRPCITVRINPTLAPVFSSLPSTAHLTAPTAIGLALPNLSS